MSLIFLYNKLYLTIGQFFSRIALYFVGDDEVSTAEIDGAILNSERDDGLPEGEQNAPPTTAYTGFVPPPTQAPIDQGGEYSISYIL